MEIKKIEIYFFYLEASINVLIRMAQFNPTEVLYFKNYYCYDEELYASHFPLEWAKNQLANTGPKQCFSCSSVGMWNGVFIGYCCYCAKLYKGKRGPGFVSYGIEGFAEDTSFNAFNTYLKDVEMDEIGDKENFMDSAEMCRDMMCHSYRFDKNIENIDVSVCEEDGEDEINVYLREIEEERNKFYKSIEEKRLSYVEEDDDQMEYYQDAQEEERLNRYYNPEAYERYRVPRERH